MDMAQESHRRIAHVLLWPGVAGTEIATLRLMRALPDFAHSAFCACHPSAASRLFAGNGFDARPCHVAELRLRRPIAFLRSSLEVARSLRASGAALLHCSDLLAGCHAGLAGRLAGLPVVCHIRNPHDELQGRHRLLLRLVTHFVFVSRYTQAHLDLTVRPGRASVIYDGLDVADVPEAAEVAAVRRELQIPSGAKVVGMVARLAPQKDHPTFIRAARRIVAVYPDTRFLVVGDNSMEAWAVQRYQALRRLIDELGLGRHFIFTGFRSDVLRLLPAMDVVVLATHFEGFGLAVLEAMAHGRPVVATAVGAIPELVADDETGLLHRPGDDAHLAGQIGSLLGDPTRAMRLAEAGRQLVKTRFTSERFASSIRELYRTLLPGGGAR
jgi:glycosyltransferase involved in cell wall biosynthesis